MSKKRKHDQVEPDAVPAQDDGPEPDQSTPAKKSKSKGQSRQEKSERRAKKKKLDTKEKRSDKKDRSSEAVTGEEDKEEGGARFLSKKKKKTKSTDEHQNGDAETESKAPKVKKEKVKKMKKSKDESDQPEGASSSSSSARFIVFVGNLPFTATAAQVQDHFVKLAPSSVRLSTDKATGKGKGFAFVEFDGYDKMKTCLKLYHHSIFDPEAKGKDKTNASQDPADFDAKKKAGRRINVELTAGGGGKQSKGRKEKIRTKNIKLDEERERTRVKERAELDEAARKKRSQPQTGANAAQVDNGSIHPSRLAQMKH